MVTLFLVFVALGGAYWLIERETKIPEPPRVMSAGRGGSSQVGEPVFPGRNDSTVAVQLVPIQTAVQVVGESLSFPGSNQQTTHQSDARGTENGFTNLHGDDIITTPFLPEKRVESSEMASEPALPSVSDTFESFLKTPTTQPQNDFYRQDSPSILMVENSFPEGEDKDEVSKNDDPSLRSANRIKSEKIEALGKGQLPWVEEPGEPERSKAVEELLFEEESSIPEKQEKAVQPDNDSVIPEKKGQKNQIALVIDDLGYNKPLSKAIVQLSADLTLAVLPGGSFSKELSDLAFSLGKELILHQPMQPQGYPKIKPGLGGLYSTMSEAEIWKTLESNFKEFPHAKGLNNHMGSQLTNEPRVMDAVMKFAKSRGFFFLDSRTSTQSIAQERAIAHGVAALKRDVFIDNIPDKHAILKKLDDLVAVAKKHGRAIGIGHPHQATLDALREWLPTLGNKKIEVARLSHFLRQTHVTGSSKPKEVRESGKRSLPHSPVSGDDRSMHHQTTVHAPKLTIVSE